MENFGHRGIENKVYMIKLQPVLKLFACGEKFVVSGNAEIILTNKNE